MKPDAGVPPFGNHGITLVDADAVETMDEKDATISYSYFEKAEFRGTDRYELRRVLGAGAMGVVYEAFDRELEDRVALLGARY